jgi:hypothetical protein
MLTLLSIGMPVSPWSFKRFTCDETIPKGYSGLA